MKLDTNRKIKVLYVEDEHILRERVASCLKYFFDVTTAENGRDGFDKFCQDRYDLVITDILMLEKTGLELINDIRGVITSYSIHYTKLYDDSEIEKIHVALTEINTNIYNNEQLKSSQNKAIFIAFMFYQLKSPELINFLKSWITKNEIFNIEELEPESIINIMNNIANHKTKKIFVAMPYFSHARVTEYNKLFKEAIKEVEESYNFV